MARRKHLDDFLRGRIIGRLECERTQLEVSEELGITQSVISRLWQRFQDDLTAKRNRRSTASDLSRQLSSATGTTVSRQTVYRRLGHIGLYARRPVRCVPLTATHCHLRLTWCREHALWTPQQWSCVMFSDEFRTSLQSDSRQTLILRVPGTRYHQENTIERHRYGGAGWLIWGGTMLGARTDLHVQSVTITSHIYRDVILEQHVRLFRGTMGAEFLFMDDNARPHRANIVDECLQSGDITRMDWPAYSPDLNPIEHVWNMLGRRIAARQPPPTCLPELRRALLDEWCNIPQDQIDNLILRMPRSYGDRFNSCQVIYSQFRLTIHQNDNQARRRFVEWTQNEIAVVPDFHKRILFSDEAHFWLNGYVNKQNCRIWSEANPQVYAETPLHPEKLTVWCALWAGGIIGPYFFKNDEDHNVTVNGDRYRAMITNFFIPELNNHDVQELWFQQDGATCHTARATIDLLKDTFGDHPISRFGPVN
ncbi:transposable element Tcb2 transposase [Trichonephila clavipes]|nr:transposable element Tcb2 transposase [Trichonephila clavipes]